MFKYMTLVCAMPVFTSSWKSCIPVTNDPFIYLPVHLNYQWINCSQSNEVFNQSYCELVSFNTVDYLFFWRRQLYLYVWMGVGVHFIVSVSVMINCKCRNKKKKCYKNKNILMAFSCLCCRSDLCLFLCEKLDLFPITERWLLFHNLW